MPPNLVPSQVPHVHSISSVHLLGDGPPGVSAPLHIPSDVALRLSASDYSEKP